MASQFLFNQALWAEFAARIPKAKKVRAAVAYFGTGAAKLLPLREGDELVVDMSLGRVRAGATDPREVQKLLKRGVTVYSRASLHAKFFIIDNIVIAGSSNISQHAKHDLDEAAVLTDDRAAIIRARTTFDALCNEPVRKAYLKQCLAEYKPPTFGGKRGATGRSKTNPTSKLWIIGGLIYLDIPEEVKAAAAASIKKTWNKLRDFEQSQVDYTQFRTLRKYTKRLRRGDWLINSIRDGKGYDAGPPVRFLGVEKVVDKKGSKRFLVMYEQPLGGESIRWHRLRAASPIILPAKPKTEPVTPDSSADALLSLWDARGKLKPKRKT